MAKHRYRIEGGRYGGELVLGEVNPHPLVIMQIKEKNLLMQF